MKSLLTSIAGSGLLAAVALAADAPRYTVTDLGPVFSAAALNDFGLITGSYTAANGTSHAALWLNGQITDISAPGLGGPNSGAFGVNLFGQVGGQAETSLKDPNNENFCGYGTGLQCLGFVWKFGQLTPLRPLGGTNSVVNAINDLGQVAGIAETSHKDPDCRPGVALNGTGPQVLDFEAVIWGQAPARSRNCLRSPATPSRWHSGLTTSAKLSVPRVRAGTRSFPRLPEARTPCSGIATARSIASAVLAGQSILRFSPPGP